MRLVRDKSQVQEPKGLTECSFVLLLEIENYLSSLSLFSLDENPIRGMLLHYHSGKKTNCNLSFLLSHAAINSLQNIFKWKKRQSLKVR